MMSTRLWRLVVICLTLLAVVAAFGACGNDDDDDQAPADDDAIDDDAADDDVMDDDLVDDDVVDDDTIDDDTIDDDTVDDDTDDLPPPSYGWIILDSNRDHVSDVLALAGQFGIDHVQLSHNLIMKIDEINEDEQQAETLQDIAVEAHGLGLEVWVWSHEFSNEPYLLCLDPESSLWKRRTRAYRQALERIPEIDGVILMFGSSDVEPWYVPCFCQWCLDLPATGNPVLDLIHSRPSDRLQQIYDAVGGVVMDEFGKKLRVRTFMHQPLEIRWLGKSLRTYPNPDLMVMSKDVPQDWQPYYPHNPLIGRVGHRHQIIEMDLGNEYWGHSAILNGQVDYIYYRYSYDREHGARGAAARLERGSSHALGTPNEINIYAFSRLLQDETATPDDVYREWFEDRYGIDPDSTAADTLKDVFRNSHYAMRKMYYTLGMWTLEKGSDVPSSARYPEQLWSRNTAYYAPMWLDVFFSLVLPKEQTLIDLWQEGAEARELAEDNLAALESVEDAFADPADYAELHEMLELHADCTEVWQLVDDVAYRYIFFLLGHPLTGPYLEWDAQRLLELADQMETRWGADISPGDPDRIRNFVDDLREGFPVQPSAEPWTQPTLFDVGAEITDRGEVLITWQSDEPMTSFVEVGTELPTYDATGEENSDLETDHTVIVEVDKPDARHVYRVGGHTAGGSLIRSGDFWFGLDP